MSFQRKIFYYKSYFQDFYNSHGPDARKKIDWVIGLVRDLEIIPVKYFKQLEGTNGLFEIRVRFKRLNFRIFCFFDEDKLIVLLQGFQKKTQKTPKNELNKAIRLKQEYYETKEK